jgi:hypothetical protein
MQRAVGAAEFVLHFVILAAVDDQIGALETKRC